MLDRFTSAARRVIDCAHCHLRRRGGREISAAELLLGVVLSDSGKASDVLHEAGVRHLLVSQALHALYKPTSIESMPVTAVVGTTRLDKEAIRVVKDAQSKANQLDSIVVTPDHILWALITGEENSALKVLGDLEVDVEKMKHRLSNYFDYKGRLNRKRRRRAGEEKKSVVHSRGDTSRSHSRRS